MPIVAAAAITVGGTLLANRSSNKAATQAAQASQAATDAAVAEQRRQYDQSRQDQMPWLNTGRGALNVLGGLYGLSSGGPAVQAYPTGQSGGSVAYGSLGDMGTAQYGQAQTAPAAGSNMAGFFASPDYQFRLNEGARALTARNSALGIQDSGAAQRSAMSFGQNLASSEYGNWYNRLAALAGVGQTAANTTAQIGQNYANNYSNLVTNNAQNLASSYQQKGANNAAMWGGLAGIGGGMIQQRWPVQ